MVTKEKLDKQGRKAKKALNKVIASHSPKRQTQANKAIIKYYAMHDLWVGQVSGE